MAGISMRSLTKEFPGGVRAVDALDLEVRDGEFFALLGPSGCGKTTLLRTVAGLESPTSGRLLIGGRDVTVLPPGDRDVAMVFQDYALFPHMNVTDNIAYPLRIKKVPARERRARAAEVGGGLALTDLMDRRPGQLSGGQQQRVAVARAVAAKPQVFLFDEPLSNLDARLRLSARTFLKRLQRDLGVTTIYVTHDQSEALALADRMAVMDQGRVRQVGTPREVFQRPANTFVAGFIGSTPMNLLPAVVRDTHLEVVGAALPAPDGLGDRVGEGAEVTVGARPEYLTLDREPRDDAIAGTVAIVENLGTELLVTVEIRESRPADTTLMQVTVPEAEEPAPGDEVWVVTSAGRTLVYGPDGELVTPESRRPSGPGEVREPA